MKFKLKKPVKYDASAKRHDYLSMRRRKQLLQRIGAGAAIVLLLLMVFVIGRMTSGGGDSTGQKGILPIFGNEAEANPLKGKTLYVDPNSNAARQAAEWRETAPEKANLMDKLADQPSSRWFSNAVTYDEVRGYVQAANDEGKLPVLVAYYIPNRDCNKYSSGGAKTADEYYDYINTLAAAIDKLEAVVILEPDALVHMQSGGPDGQPCLDDMERQMYATLLSYAVDRFKSLRATSVYIDAGNSGWHTDADTISGLLKKVGIDQADGFSLNVSNFRTTDETVKLGKAISDRVDNKHYVIDTSRNGLGPYENPQKVDYNWCNPPGRALGHYPTADTGIERVDAFLYIKNIGESDGTDADPFKCFGGPRAGEWWADYAVGLVERWPKELQYDSRP